MILTIIISMVKSRLITSDTQRRNISRLKSNVRLKDSVTIRYIFVYWRLLSLFAKNL